MAQPDDTLTLVAGGQRLTGWESVSVTRGIEIMPSSFEIGLTEKYPGQAADIVVKPGDPCVVLIGNDPVVTGYIDRYLPAMAPRRCTQRRVLSGEFGSRRFFRISHRTSINFALDTVPPWGGRSQK